MIGQAQTRVSERSALSALLALVADDGSASHRHLNSDAMSKGREAARTAADAVHHLALLHARHPGVLDHAVERTSDSGARAIVGRMADAFGAERALLARLVVAVGPLPSTPGHANAESAVMAQHHAIEMLARSDRNGCATGAALALAVDWIAIRPVLDNVASQLGLEVVPTELMGVDSLAAALAPIEFGLAAERAMMFGAQQIIAQHNGLWDLLEARAVARAYD
jgi:hypothetical protein